MKVRMAVEYTFGDDEDKLDPEVVKKCMAEQMELADVYFTVERPGQEPWELSPTRIEVLSTTVEP